MLDKIKAFLTWQIVTVLVAGLVVFACIAIFASSSTQTILFGVHGFFFSLVTLAIESPFKSSRSSSSTPPPSEPPPPTPPAR